MDVKRCNRCVLTDKHSSITFNKDGICNYCLSFTSNTAENREKELEKLLSKHKKKDNKYDCLVMLSGGKDSTYTLYLLKKQYDVNILGFTFDNGFESEEAWHNIKNATDILGVDQIFVKKNHIRKLFYFILKNKLNVPLCAFCRNVIRTTAIETAKKYDISLIFSGDLRGTLINSPELRDMSYRVAKIFFEHIRDVPAFRSYHSEYFGKRIHEREPVSGLEIVPMYDYFSWDKGDILNIIRNELNWQFQEKSFPLHSTNCLMNIVGVYLSLKHFGYAGIYDSEMSNLVRAGKLKREDALQALEFNFDDQIIESILNKINLSLSDIT
jgi:hypothetical protein